MMRKGIAKEDQTLGVQGGHNGVACECRACARCRFVTAPDPSSKEEGGGPAPARQPLQIDRETTDGPINPNQNEHGVAVKQASRSKSGVGPFVGRRRARSLHVPK